jgi:acetylornithine deacetylase
MNMRGMNIFELTRALIDIDSVTPNEEAVGNYLFDHLSEIAGATGGHVEHMEVEPRRFNVFAWWDRPVVTFSTHMDTVPPFYPSSEDGELIRGRGACDTKGIIASMITAVEQLLAAGERRAALLFVIGEERNSAGAMAAAKQPRGSRYLINGEPTDNKLALGSKGALRYEVIARGRMAHSAYPHLGESAIEKLLDALEQIRRLPLPRDPMFGPGTLNIGTLQGGRAPNVIPDYAMAEIFFRLVDNGSATRDAMANLKTCVELREVGCLPALKFSTLDGFETCMVSFLSDITAFDGSWGTPFLIGPGSIHVAHTAEERVAKSELIEAVEIYKNMARRLVKRGNQ